MSDWKLITWRPDELNSPMKKKRHVLLFFPTDWKGRGGVQAATIYHEADRPTAFYFWEHGSPDATSDWECDEAPTHWMLLPSPPIVAKQENAA
ncbi:MAG: DUF551 domain-containing protein [Gemmatimonadaceae bacterium]|nr:DUF551 domain-containing protein [Gemmatimonadaceae bacterium]